MGATSPDFGSGGVGSGDVDALLAALRRWGSTFAEASRRFGVHTGMHGTDAAALVHIIDAEDDGAPLTHAALRRRIGLSTGATSSLLDRLERAGHVERRRESTDRRVVMLRSTAAVHREVEEFFAAMGAGLRAELDGRDGAELRRLAEVATALTRSLERHLVDGAVAPGVGSDPS